MRTISTRFGWQLIAALFGFSGCVGAVDETSSANAENEIIPCGGGDCTVAGQIRYGSRKAKVPALDDPNGPLSLGAHQVLVPVKQQSREPIDSANRPSRLHRDLNAREDNYLVRDDQNHKLVSMSQSGAAEFDVFPSSWWPQASNGIAARWQMGDDENYGDRSHVDTLSPAEKYDILTKATPRTVAAVSHCDYSDVRENNCTADNRHTHDAVQVAGPATEWELTHHGNYQRFSHPDGWWGHCNGWSSYATAETLGWPRRDIRAKLVNGAVRACQAGEAGCVLFSVGDIEALMTEVYFSDSATFAGRRCNDDPDKMEYDDFGRPKNVACRDINAGTFHVAVTGMMGDHQGVTGADGHVRRTPFVIDHQWDWEVWNFPLTSFKIKEEELLDSAQAAMALIQGANPSATYTFNPAARQFVRIKLEYEMISDGVGDEEMSLPADERSGYRNGDWTELNYVLELDNDFRILGGEWLTESYDHPEWADGADGQRMHPDFLWTAIRAQGAGENSDDTGGNDDNPALKYPVVQGLLRCANEPASCGDTVTPTQHGSWTGSGTVDKDAAAPADQAKSFRIELPPNARKIVIRMAGTQASDGADADLYYRFGAEPTAEEHDGSLESGGNEDSGRIQTATGTVLFLQLFAYAGKSDIQLEVTWQY